MTRRSSSTLKENASPAKQRKVSKSKEDEFECETCGKQFSQQSQRDYHAAFHKVDEKKILRVKVENVKDLGGLGKGVEVESDDRKGQIEFGTIKVKWAVAVARVDNYLQVQLICKRGRDCAIWEGQVEGEIKLVAKSDDSLSKCKIFNEMLNDQQYLITNRLLEWDQLENSVYMVDGNIDIEVRILMKSMYGKRTCNSIYFSSPSSYSDIILVAEKQKFHVSKAIVAHASAHFNDQFYRKSKGFLVKEYYPSGITAATLKTGLNLIYDRINELDKNNWKQLLKMADDFKIPKITDIVEIWLLNNECVPLHEILLMAEQYKLDVVKAIKLREFDSFDKVEELRKSVSFEKFSDELKKTITEKMAELSGW